MNTSSTPLLLSLKPRYADLVFGGQKKVELRRRVTKKMRGREVFVYVSNPARILRGGFTVGDVTSGTPEEVWDEVCDVACVEKTDFDDYYAGRKVAHAFEITDVWEFARPLDLNSLRRDVRNFVVPQSWRYLKPDEFQIFQDMESRVGFEVNNHPRPIEAAVRYAH